MRIVKSPSDENMKRMAMGMVMRMMPNPTVHLQGVREIAAKIKSEIIIVVVVVAAKAAVKKGAESHHHHHADTMTMTTVVVILMIAVVTVYHHAGEKIDTAGRRRKRRNERNTPVTVTIIRQLHHLQTTIPRKKMTVVVEGKNESVRITSTKRVRKTARQREGRKKKRPPKMMEFRGLVNMVSLEHQITTKQIPKEVLQYGLKK